MRATPPRPRPRPRPYLGSEVAAYRLGEAFYKGWFGLPKDPVRARSWLKKVVVSYKLKCLSGKSMTDAAEMLRELDEQAGAREE